MFLPKLVQTMLELNNLKLNLTSHSTENLAFNTTTVSLIRTATWLWFYHIIKHKSDNASLEELANQLEPPLQAQLEQDVSQWYFYLVCH